MYSRYFRPTTYLFLLLLFLNNDPAGAQEMAGRKIRITVHSEALEGNLIGDTPDREVSIYLPPGYDSSPQKMISGGLHVTWVYGPR